MVFGTFARMREQSKDKRSDEMCTMQIWLNDKNLPNEVRPTFSSSILMCENWKLKLKIRKIHCGKKANKCVSYAVQLTDRPQTNRNDTHQPSILNRKKRKRKLLSIYEFHIVSVHFGSCFRCFIEIFISANCTQSSSATNSPNTRTENCRQCGWRHTITKRRNCAADL